MSLDRNLVLVLIISLISAIAGVTFYRLTMDQPEFISASSNVNSTPHSSTVSSQPATLSFEEIVLNDLETNPRQLNEWKKPILVVNFWAPWCPPCRREIPALVELQKTYQQQVQLIGLSFDTLQNVTEFSEKTPMNYPLLLVQKESTMINSFFGNNTRALPFTAILNGQREIVFKHNGEITKEMLDTQIKALL